jgi:serine/threonine protein kinase
VTPERWRQINDLFHAALELQGAARQSLLERTSASDPELAAEVRSLLAVHHSSDRRFLEEPAWAVAPTLAFEDPPIAAGTDIGPYRVVREIGRGGMGVVYEAEDTRLRRTVALKALPSEYARDPVRRERLTREARAAASLTHPAIATIYALDEVNGSLYLVSELVRGHTLREELARGPLPPERLLPTLIELASGLAAAHAAGIVHRDFKPENIVRCLDGRVKILDFGLARLAMEESRLTQTGTTLGTPGYMPPEQLAGQEIDARTDVFAFGVVAWELATGVHPLGATTADLMGRMADLLDGKTLNPSGPRVPIAGLESILRRSLRKSPAERYRSAEFIVPELQALRLTGTAPALDPAPDGTSSRSPLWWWQFHQAIISLVIAAMPVGVWFVRDSHRTAGIRLFLAVLALSTVSVTIRLNLLFTSRVNFSQLAAHRRRLYRTMAIVEGLLGVLLLIGAAFVAGENDALASVLVTLAVATVASLGVIEPAATSAARIDE